MLVEELLERWGEPIVLAVLGAAVGFLFGWAAQRSRFCLRAAALEVAEGKPGARLAVWLLSFAVALALVQGAIALGVLDVSGARQIAATGSLSGAVVGGLLFGAGMILARGCASRLLVLASSGNLRALVAGLVLTVVAQASLNGVLTPAREAVAGLWTVEGGADRALLAAAPAGHAIVATLGLLGAWAAGLLARSAGVPGSRLLAAVTVGAAVALGWTGTWTVARASFEVVEIGSITFTGPSVDTLMALITQSRVPMSFPVGLVPGVALGAALSAMTEGTFRIERFGADTPVERYLVGAALMGFGAMLAGGCAVGAAVSGAAILALTPVLAGLAMWVGAAATALALGDAGPQPSGAKA